MDNWSAHPLSCDGIELLSFGDFLPNHFCVFEGLLGLAVHFFNLQFFLSKYSLFKLQIKGGIMNNQLMVIEKKRIFSPHDSLQSWPPPQTDRDLEAALG
jgi:hypothetical protein